MKITRWYIVSGENENGNYSTVKEEDTDLIVAHFTTVNNQKHNLKLKEISSMVYEHNAVVKIANKAK